jgi:hypothetical protein
MGSEKRDRSPGELRSLRLIHKKDLCSTNKPNTSSQQSLSQARVFTLQGLKRLYQTDTAIDVVVIDVTETPIERPKKNKNTSLAVRRKSILSSLKS